MKTTFNREKILKEYAKNNSPKEMELYRGFSDEELEMFDAEVNRLIEVYSKDLPWDKPDSLYPPRDPNEIVIIGPFN